MIKKLPALVSTTRPTNGTLVICIITSEITEIADAETKIDLLILAKIKKGITKKMTVISTGTGTLNSANSVNVNHINCAKIIYEYI